MSQSKKEQPGYDPLTDNPIVAEDLPTPSGQQKNFPEPEHNSDILDLKSPLVRIVTAVITMALIVVVVLVMRSFFLPKSSAAQGKSSQQQPIPTFVMDLPAPSMSTDAGNRL